MRAVIALVPFLLLAACDRQTAPAPQPRDEAVPAPEAAGALDISQRGRAMPKDGFTDPSGAPVTLARFKGKPVLVNLWATWCGPCVKELPSLDRLAAKAAGKLQVVAVNQDFEEQAKDPVPAFWTAHQPATLQLYRDQKNLLQDAFATGQLPTTVLYDEDGKEVWRIVGGMDWEGPRANTLLADILG